VGCGAIAIYFLFALALKFFMESLIAWFGWMIF